MFEGIRQLLRSNNRTEIQILKSLKSWIIICFIFVFYAHYQCHLCLERAVGLRQRCRGAEPHSLQFYLHATHSCSFTLTLYRQQVCRWVVFAQHFAPFALWAFSLLHLRIWMIACTPAVPLSPVHNLQHCYHYYYYCCCCYLNFCNKKNPKFGMNKLPEQREQVKGWWWTVLIGFWFSSWTSLFLESITWAAGRRRQVSIAVLMYWLLIRNWLRLVWR